MTRLKKLILLMLMVAGVGQTARAQGWDSGPTTVFIEQVATYVYRDDVLYLNWGFNVTNGWIQSTSKNGIDFSVTVYWNQVGNGSVSFTNNGATISTLPVTINDCPTTQFNVGGGGPLCGAPSVNVTLSGSLNKVNYQLKLDGADVGAAVPGNGSPLSWTVSAAGNYTITGYATMQGCTRTMIGNAYVSAAQGSVGGSIAPALKEGYGPQEAGLTLSGHTGTIQKWQYNSSGSWVDIANTTTSYGPQNVTTPTQYRAEVKSGQCPVAYSTTATVAGYAAPVITGNTTVALGASTSLTVQSGYYSYQWTKNGADIPGATTTTLNITTPATYGVKVKGSATATVATASHTVLTPADAQTGINFTRVTVLKQPGHTTMPDVYTLNAADFAQAISYSDPLGRAMQTIGVQQSPAGKDIVTPVAYDENGRVRKAYLPYVSANNEGKYRRNALDPKLPNPPGYANSEQYLFYQGTPKVAQSTAPYAASIFEKSPSGRVKEQGAPGTPWQPGTGHTVRSDVRVYTLSASAPAVLKNVRKWTTAGPSASYYSDSQLLAQKTMDENGNEVWVFTDKLGRTILKRVQINETIEGQTIDYLETYFVYDDRGNLALQVPPKSVARYNSGSYPWSTAFRDEWCFVYIYDARDRLIEKKSPGAAWEYIVYDSLDRVVLTQDGNLKAANKWNFVKYDYKGRVVYTGIYLNTTQTTRADVQALCDAGTTWYESEEINGTYQGYSNTVFPTTGLTVLTANYYDHYDFDRNGSADYAYDNTHLAGQEATPVANVLGLPTGSKRVMLDAAGNVTSTWLIGAVFYDKFYRPIQTISNNHLYTTVADKNTAIYDFSGKVLKSKTTHSTAASTSISYVDRTDYDHAGRPLKIYRQINSDPEQFVAQYDYNELGQLVDKKLHNTGGSNFLQSVDYRYSIRGWLRSINGSKLTVNADNDDTNDLFGMNVLYDSVDTGLGNTAYYNGNINALKWKGPGQVSGATDQRSYKYTYDKTDRLKVATFQAHNGSVWTKEAGTLDESMTYDHNGNILTLTRKQNQRALSGTNVTATPQTIDQLTYTYAAGNQLSKVEDAALTAGFNNGKVNGAAEYTYNTDGSLIKDENKNISAITYNILGKPQQITYTDGKTIVYTYDATGNKLKMAVTVSGVTTTTDYAGSFVYTNNTLSFFGSPEGRVVKNGSTYEYQYAISDHQGNTRLIFSSQTPTPVAPTATFEGDGNDQASQYTNVNGANVVTFLSANHTTSGSKVIRMNQTYKIGPAKSIKVFAGDKIDLEVWEYHEGTSGFGTTSTPAGTLINMIASAFGGVSGGAGESGMIYSGVNSAISGFTPLGNQGDTRPAAYLNYILFDQNYKVLDMGWQLAPATTFTKQKLSFPQLTIKEAGYIFVYLSYDNDSNNWVYFDDLKVTHTKSNVIQYNEFYNHGSPNANSWTRENSTGNNFLANGGTELNSTSSLYDLDFRNFDPILGRMHQVDPMADKYGSATPYNFSFNNPVSLNDPSGADPFARDDYWREMDMQNRARRSMGSSGGVANDLSKLQRAFGVSLSFGALSYSQEYRDQMRQDALYLTTEQYAEKYGQVIYSSSGSVQGSSNLKLWNPWGGEQTGENTYNGAWQNFDLGLAAKIAGEGYSIKTSVGSARQAAQKYSFSVLGWAPLDYEEGRYSAQMLAEYAIDVNISVFEVPIYNSDFKVIGSQHKVQISATSYVSSKGAAVIPRVKVSIGMPTGMPGVEWVGGFDSKILKVGRPALIRGGGQYTYAGEATFDINNVTPYKIKIEANWAIEYDNSNRFVPINAPYIGLPIGISEIITLQR